jgi:hypothetical protein
VPVEQHPHGGEQLLHTQRPVFLLELLNIAHAAPSSANSISPGPLWSTP